MTTPKKSPNLNQRILAIIEASGELPKSGKAHPSMGGFEYHKIDTVIGHLRKLMIDHGVVMDISCNEHEMKEITDANGKTVFFTSATVTISLINAEDPDDRSDSNMFGYALDYQDKGPGKCVSYCMKTYLLNRFMLRGQPDNEDDHIGAIHASRSGSHAPATASAGNPASDKQLKYLTALGTEDQRWGSHELFHSWVNHLFGKDITELTSREASLLIEKIKTREGFGDKAQEAMDKAIADMEELQENHQQMLAAEADKAF